MTNEQYDAMEAFAEIEMSVKYRILEDLRKRKKTQYVKKLPAGRLSKIWKRFADIGIVTDDKGLDSIVGTTIESIAVLVANTMFSGHTQEDPKQHMIYEMEVSEEEAAQIFSWLEEVNGYQYFRHISDYSCNRLVDLALKLINAKKSAEKIMYVDLCLNVIHQSSDLSELFIEGGSGTLDCLFYGYEEAMGHKLVFI